MGALVSQPRIIIRKDPIPGSGQWHVLCRFCPAGKQARCWCPEETRLKCFPTWEVAARVARNHWNGTHAREV